MKKSDLQQLIKEEISNISSNKLKSKQEVSQLVNDLIRIGYKKSQIGIDRGYGVYFITLPQSSLSISSIVELSKILPEGSLIGIYRDIYSGLSIKTPIRI